MKKGICFILIMVVTIQIALTGCIEKKAKSGFTSDITRDYPVYGIRSVPDNLYMLQNEGAEEKNLLYLLFSGLVKTDEKGNIVPSLAANWTVDKDNTTYTFSLRDGLYWSDGTAIKADDFMNFFKEICKPGFNNKKLYELNCITGIQDYTQGKIKFNSVGISAKDEKTLVIKLNYPCSYFLNILSQPEYALKRIDMSDNWTENIKNIVSSGPFILGGVHEDTSGKRNIILQKNLKYWDKDRTVSKKIVVIEEKNCESAMADFETGKIDLFISPPESEKARLFEGNEACACNFNSADYLFFNLKRDGAVSDVNFRKAVNSLISRKDLIKKDEESFFSAKESFLNDSSGVYFSSSDNTEYANKLMQQAKNVSNLKLTAIYDSEDPSKKIYENLFIMLKKKLQCKIDVIGLNKSDLEAKLKKGDFDIAMLKVDNYSKSNILSLDRLIYGQGQYSAFYNDHEFLSMLSSLNAEKNPYKQNQILSQCEKKLFDDMPLIPICSSKLTICKNNYITGINVLDNGCIDLQALYILKDNSK